MITLNERKLKLSTLYSIAVLDIIRKEQLVSESRQCFVVRHITAAAADDVVGCMYCALSGR